MEYISSVPIAPLIIGFVLVVGLVVLGIKQLISGWPLSKNLGNKKGECPAPKCNQTVIETATKVEILEENQAKVFTKVEKIADDVSFIRGKMDD